MPENIYDLIIIGGGPAGLTAGLYATRGGLNCLLLEKSIPGGQILLTDVIENFPGFSKPVRGLVLVNEILEQAKRFGLNIESDKAAKISHLHKDGHRFIIETASKKRLKTLAIVVATGATWKRLGVQGEEALISKGVSYCATCDGPLFKGRDMVVVGGGDKALEEALFLANIANSVKLIHRRDRFRAIQELQDRVLDNEKIEPIYDSVVTEVCGRNSVESVKILNKKTKKADIIPCAAVFIFIGIEPNSRLLKEMVDLDEKSFVITEKNMKTSQDGIYACGDVIKKDLYQVVTAVGEAATAAFNAQKYIEELKGKAYS